MPIIQNFIGMVIFVVPIFKSSHESLLLGTYDDTLHAYAVRRYERRLKRGPRPTISALGIADDSGLVQ
jgi:hypothetical protein